MFDYILIAFKSAFHGLFEILWSKGAQVLSYLESALLISGLPLVNKVGLSSDLKKVGAAAEYWPQLVSSFHLITLFVDFFKSRLLLASLATSRAISAAFVFLTNKKVLCI
jgi:hypothetical protein